MFAEADAVETISSPHLLTFSILSFTFTEKMAGSFSGEPLRLGAKLPAISLDSGRKSSNLTSITSK